jgi:hypothetical protein
LAVVTMASTADLSPRDLHGIPPKGMLVGYERATGGTVACRAVSGVSGRR